MTAVRENLREALTDLDLKTALVNYRSKTNGTIEGEKAGGFKSLLDNAEKSSAERAKNDVKNDHRDRRKTDNRDNRYFNDGGKTDTDDDKAQTVKQPVAKTKEPVQTDAKATDGNPQDAGAVSAKKGADKAVKPANAKSDAVDAKIVKAVAEALNVEEEVVTATLDDLGIAAAALVEPENAAALEVAVFGLNDKIELLAVPNIAETTKALKGAVQNALTAETETVDENLEAFAAQVVKAAADTGGKTDNDAFGGNTDDNDANKSFKQTPTVETVRPNAVLAQMKSDSAAATEETPATTEEVSVKAAAVTTTAAATARAAVEAEVVESAAPQTEAEPADLSATVNAAVVSNAARVTEAEANVGRAAAVEIGEVSAAGQTGGVTANENRAETATVTAQTQRTAQTVVNRQDVINQVVERLKVELKPDSANEIRVRLRPEHLGDVTLKIATQNGIVTAQFAVESQRVKEIIEAEFNALRSSLREQGVNVDSLEVTVGQEEADEREAMYGQGRARFAHRNGGVTVADAEEIKAEIVREGLVDYRV